MAIPSNPVLGSRTSSADDGFRPDIEGLRGVAVALVVLYHAALFAVVGGFVGVDVFFVISGFLITGLLLREVQRRGRISFRHFYARRVRRLVPAGALVLILTMVATNLIAGPLDRPDLLLDGAAAALSVGNLRSAAAASDYFTAVTTPSPFLHFWSLAVEEQFYLVWPALLVLAVGLGRGRRARATIGFALVLVLVVSLALSLWMTEASVNWAFYSLPTRAWQLAAGGLLAVMQEHIRRLPAKVLVASGCVGLATIVASALFIDASVSYPGTAALAPTLGSIGVLVAAGRGPARVLTLPPVRFLGQISYSLYLWHWPLLVLPAMALGTEPALALRVGLVGLAIVAATLSWRYVEMPFRNGFGGRLARWPGRVLAGGLASLAAIAVLAGGIAYQDGRSLTAAAAYSTKPGNDTGFPVAGASSVPDAGGPGSTRTPAMTPGHSAWPAVDTGVSYALPADVHPTPAGARADTTEAKLRADGCMGLDATTVPPPCVYGDMSGSFTLALVGDSHAAQWFTALDAIAVARGWRLEVFTKVRCPFMDLRMQNIALKREYTECETWDRAVVASLVAHPPGLTLISADRNWIAPIDPSDATVVTEAAAEARLVAQLPGRVGLLVDTPGSDQDVPACLAAHPTDIRPCAFSRTVAYANAIGAREAAVASATGVGLIDLNDLICPFDPCQPIIDGVLIFRDNSHLTATFSMALAPALAREIDRVLMIRPESTR